MRAPLPCLVSMVAVIAAVDHARAGDQGAIAFRGNVVLVDEVYLAVLERYVAALPDGARDEVGPQEVASALETFLHDSGYELARVTTQIRDGHLEVDIDEGRLDKIVFRGRSTARALQLLAELAVPHDVYNRPFIARQLREFTARNGVTTTFALVPRKDVEHLGPQLEDLGSFQGFAAIPPPGDYELHVRLLTPEWSTGLGVHARASGTDGLVLGASWSATDFLLDGDRGRLRLDGGMHWHDNLEGGGGRVRHSLATLDGRWYTPELAGRLRPFLWTHGDMWLRQRPDLGLEAYRWVESTALLSLGWEPAEGLELSFGLGAQSRWLTEVDRLAATAINGFVPGHREYSVANMRAELTLDLDELRLDRQHRLVADWRLLYGDGQSPIRKLSWRYDKVFGLGWHDLWIRSRGSNVWGDAAFADEVPVSNHLRGVFSMQYAPHVESVSVELRASITRDLYKVSVFADGAVFENIRKLELWSLGRGWHFGTCVGMGFHALVGDLVQLDLYYGVGFASGRERDQGLSVALMKAF